MDPGRYGVQQGWDNNNNNSALEGYGAVHEPNFRIGGSYDERRFFDERYDPRNSFHHEIIDRDTYPPPPPPPPPPAVGFWQPRRRNCEEFPNDRESRRYEKQYVDPYYEIGALHEPKLDKFQEFDNFRDRYRSEEGYRDHGFENSTRIVGRDQDDYAHDDYDYRSRVSSREDSRERDHDYGRHSYDSDYDGGSRGDGDWRRRDSRDRERELSPYRRYDRERDQSPYRRHERSRSRGREDRPRSRSPRGRSYGRSHREDSFEDAQYEKRPDRIDKRQREYFSVAPSATVVVKGLSQKTSEEDLYQILAEWGPLRHVRVIKERNSGTSRGFAFIDFNSLGAARAMMDKLGDDGLIVDGKKLFFEYSSKPTGGAGGSFGQVGSAKSGHINHKSMTLPSDWMCTSCGCINFARRTSCFQCNEVRSEDAPAADVSLSNTTASGKKGADVGPTHVLVVRGLDENADEEMIRYEFSKHAPIKDLRLVRDKFTHVSRGFAFVHFHSVEDSSKALEATNGTTLEKNGQILRVAYAKSILGQGTGSLGHSQSSSLAAAAIEAAIFSQQYDAVGWVPKEYNPDDSKSSGEPGQSGKDIAGQKESLAPQSGFIWDEASGYYYDAASGFYYDGNSGLYYDGNSGTWYAYDQQKQQYIPCTDQHENKTSETSKAPSDGSNDRKVVISAPATTTLASSLPDAVHAAAAAAIAAEKKEKEKSKEIKLASKTSILANKKKMNNVLTMWKQRSHEGQANRAALDDNNQPADGKPFFGGQSMKNKAKTEVLSTKENSTSGVGLSTNAPPAAQNVGLESPVKPRPVSNSFGGSLMGVIRGSGRGVVKSDTLFPANSVSDETVIGSASLNAAEMIPHVATPFKTDTSALGAYAPPVSAGTGKRRFSEMPLATAPPPREPQSGYRDRAAERRSLYGSSSSVGDEISDSSFGSSNQDFGLRKGPLDSMPFPPGVGGGRPAGDASVDSYEVITSEKAIDDKNVGNRMLRSMGWHDGLGLGKDGSGMTEPVQAQASDNRAGLGSRQKKPVDPSLEVQAGDSYKTLIHKKALARFREMS